VSYIEQIEKFKYSIVTSLVMIGKRHIKVYCWIFAIMMCSSSAIIRQYTSDIDHLSNLSNSSMKNEAKYTLPSKFNVKSSTVVGRITIDGDAAWLVAKANGICTGNGTYSETYIIQNFVVDGEEGGPCIWIQGSTMFFKIENCTTFNSGGAGWENAGITLTNVINGQLIDNNCTQHVLGMQLENCNDTMIIGNNASVNSNCGIMISGGRNITLESNIFNFNGIYGLEIEGATNNTFLDNSLCNNGNSGLHVKKCVNMTISDNVANNHVEIGFYGEESENIIISKNDFCHNNFSSLFLGNFSNSITRGNLSVPGPSPSVTYAVVQTVPSWVAVGYFSR